MTLTVTDTGTGMTPEVQARLFEPFFTTKDVGQGTGLGLAMVHGTVARSGGSVTVTTRPGHGSSFQVAFPSTPGSAAAAPLAPDRTTRPRLPYSVLVVEDAPALRDMVRRILTRKGYTVVLAANADEAVRLFSEHPNIDILLTDVVMPGASGPELTQRLLGRRPGLKVVYMSGYTDEAIVQHGVINPGIAFLQKPFSAEALDGKLREVLDRESSP